MVLFGIYGLVALRPHEMLFYAGFAPAALGSVIAIGMVGRWMHFREARWRLAHTFYALTGDRALIATETAWNEPLSIASVTGEMFDDTLCIEQAGGQGDVYFVAGGAVIEPEIGLVGLIQPHRVEELVRSVLLGLGPKSESGAGPTKAKESPFWAGE